MSMQGIFDELMASDDITAEKILQYLLTSDKSLSMKTHIIDPVALAIYKAYLGHIKEMKLKKSEKILKEFLISYLEYMVSYKRLGREEIIRALTSLRNEKSTFADKLMGRELER
jgi:hypothetical protein